MNDNVITLSEFDIAARGMFETENIDKYHVKVAQTLEEACKLIEAGFEYVTEMDDAKVFRKQK